MTSLIRNTSPKPTQEASEALDKASYHIQAAMQELRDDPAGTLEFEQMCGAIYHHLYEAMNLLVTGPKAGAARLQSDLDAVMGGVADGPTEVPPLPQQTTTPE